MKLLEIQKLISNSNLNIAKERIFLNEPMKKHTTFRIGGVADFFKLNVEEGKLDIITNPPYNDRLAEIISRCIKLCR